MLWKIPPIIFKILHSRLLSLIFQSYKKKLSSVTSISINVNAIELKHHYWST